MKQFFKSLFTPAKASPARSMASVVESARRGGYKGYFYFPTLEVSHWSERRTRVQSAQDAEWLYEHSGAARMIIDGLALDETDTGLWPKADTENEAYNVALNEAFDNMWGSDPRFFDVARQETFYSAQMKIRRAIRLHGEIFGQLIRPDPSTGAVAPRLNLIPMHHCDAGLFEQEKSEGWNDGIYFTAEGTPSAYRFVIPGKKPGEKEKVRVEPFDDILHFHDPLLPGRVRGKSSLEPVLNKLFSIDDIDKASTSGEVLRSRIAYAIMSKGPEGGMSLLPGAAEVSEEEVTNPDGTKTKTLVQKIVAGDGTEVDVLDLPDGKEVKLVESAKASSAVDWNNHLLRDVAFSQLYPPEYIFSLAGGTQGTMVRLMQSRVQRIIRNIRFFQMEPQYVRRTWTFFAWQLIRAGYFENLGIEVPAAWWRMKCINPADMTVDLGREGRLFDERLNTGKMDDDEYHGLRGRDGDDVDRRVIRRYFKRIAMIEEEAARAGRPAPPAGEIFKSPAGQQTSAPEKEKSNPDEEEEE
jgi:hypothetical protein